MSKAPTWRDRHQALHTVLRNYKLSDPDVRTGIVQLFNRETDDPKWQDEAENDDAFNWYYEEVSQLCKRVAQTDHQQDAWRVLLRMRFWHWEIVEMHRIFSCSNREHLF